MGIGLFWVIMTPPLTKKNSHNNPNVAHNNPNFSNEPLILVNKFFSMAFKVLPDPFSDKY